MSTTESAPALSLDDKLSADIRAELEKAPASGQSISFLATSLRDRGWRRLGNSSAFESTLERLGFEIEHVYKAGGRTVRMTLVRGAL